MARHPDVPLWAAGRRRRQQRRRVLHAGRAALLDQGQQRGLRRDRRGDRRPAARADAALPAQRRPHQVGPWRVAALGGTFAPSWYHTPAAALPPSRGARRRPRSLKLGKSRDDKRRHFVRDEVLACKALTSIDVFLTHEAPRPFYPAGRRIDAGQDGAQRRAGRDAAAAAPVRPPSRVHRLGRGRASDRSGSTW